MTDPWRAQHFGIGFSAEYLPCGQRTWRMVKQGKEAVLFPTRDKAREAAKSAYLDQFEPKIRATLERSPEEQVARMEAKLLGEAENWLKSSRQDVKQSETRRKPGKRPLLVMPGRATG